MKQLLHSQAGEAERQWHKEFGSVVRLRNPFGQDSLLISDPKAIRVIYGAGEHRFGKSALRRELLRLVGGRGLLWAYGDIHRRHRKLNAPAFAGAPVKSQLPVIQKYADKFVNKLRENVRSRGGDPQIDMVGPLHEAAVDVIGETGFGYEFGSLDNKKHPLVSIYSKLSTDTFGSPPPAQIIMQALFSYIPGSIVPILMEKLPSKLREGSKKQTELATALGRQLVAQREEAGSDGKDVLSMLLKANKSEDPKTALSEEEVLASIQTVLTAGNDTTANTLAWFLFELARRPDIQGRLREEIRGYLKGDGEGGDRRPGFEEYESLEYFQAVLKEVLRFHPSSYLHTRIAVKDEVLPLQEPITTTTGRSLNEVFVPKGMSVYVSVNVVNRDKENYGPDADTFNPDRWLTNPSLRSLEKSSIGVYGNTLSFGMGPRSCIGWRLAVLELQVFMISLVSNFRFRIDEEVEKRMRREACVLSMVPTLEGEVDKGPQMPLIVKEI